MHNCYTGSMTKKESHLESIVAYIFIFLGPPAVFVVWIIDKTYGIVLLAVYSLVFGLVLGVSHGRDQEKLKHVDNLGHPKCDCK